MLLTNTNINPLPFYDSLDKQYHRQRYACRHAIYTGLNHLIPFQLFTTIQSATFTCILKDLNDNTIATFNNSEIGLKRYLEGIAYQITYCTGVESSTNFMEAGKRYYLQVKVGTGTTAVTFYSDLFEATPYLTDMVKLTYWNNQRFDVGDYKTLPIIQNQGYFGFRHWIPTDIGKPAYPFVNYISEREAYKYPLKMISNKEFKFPIQCTESQFDALRLALISDYVAIEQNGQTYKVLWIEWSEIEWNEYGIGKTMITFTVDSVVNSFAQAKPTRGDFSDDFNEDFLI